MTSMRSHARELIALALILAAISHWVIWPLLPIAVILVCVALLVV